jgi:hypothetical protein
MIIRTSTEVIRAITMLSHMAPYLNTPQYYITPTSKEEHNDIKIQVSNQKHTRLVTNRIFCTCVIGGDVRCSVFFDMLVSCALVLIACNLCVLALVPI